MIEEVSRNEMLSTIHYMTEHFPYRLAGSPCEAAASRYVTERLKQYGLEVENKEFYTYNSDPMYSKVTVLEPEMEIDSLPCAHIRATKPEGEIFELIYVGNGDYAAYKDIDVTGKMVLVEVSYAPPVPEKARIAYEMGAAGIMCMNWGNDEEVICRRGLKGVWGNPTEANFHCIPEIVGVGVTRGAGLKLKQLCLEGRKVEVKVTAIADRTWSIVHQPTAILHGNGSSDEFLLVCSHLDAWKPGVTCNATGNATTLEICRILSKHRQELDRDVYFVFWDGHEVAEAAGSTWFVDNNWDNLNKHCVCYMHIDSTGVKETELYEIKASEELLGFAKKNINDVLPELELRAMALKKIGDQSFMGIGVSSITQRKSFTKEYMAQVKTIGEAVRNMSVLMANMYYHLTKAVIEDFGDEAKESFKRAIIEFGHERGRNIAKNVLDAGLPLTLENLDKFYDIPIAEGWDLHRSYENDMKMNVTDSCTFATVWLEKNWAEVGHIYCLIDIAIREGYSSNVKFCPVKNILEGDPHCQSLTVYRDISKKGQ